MCLLFSLKLEGHGYTEVGVVDGAVGEHEVYGDDGGQHVDLTYENECQGQQAGQTDGCNWGPVGAFLLGGGAGGRITIQTEITALLYTCKSSVHQVEV